MLRRLLVFTPLMFICNCDEALPPRVDPFSIPPTDFLEVGFSVVPGNVLFLSPTDTIPIGDAGLFEITARNITDEVLQGKAQITIDISYHLAANPFDIKHAIGDSNNLRNVYNFNGNHFMLEGNLFTLEPDSIARFYVLMNHVQDEWWNLANPTVIPPSYFGGIFTNDRGFSAFGEFSLFEGYPPILLKGITFPISYQFTWGGIVWINDERVSLTNEGLVKVEWTIDDSSGLSFNAWKGVVIQRSTTERHEDFRTISGFVGSPFLDQPGGGTTYYYRVAQIEDHAIYYTLNAITGYSSNLRIFVP